MEDHRKNPRPKRKKGFQVFKTIAALKLASRNEGVSSREMSEKLELSTSSAYGTLKALEEAGEVAEDKGRFYSDVYADGTTNPLIVRSSEAEAKPEDNHMAFIDDVRKKYYEMYPKSMFGETGEFIHDLITRITNDLLISSLMSK